jgi:hypothetical protein
LCRWWLVVTEISWPTCIFTQRCFLSTVSVLSDFERFCECFVSFVTCRTVLGCTGLISHYLFPNLSYEFVTRGLLMLLHMHRFDFGGSQPRGIVFLVDDD